MIPREEGQEKTSGQGSWSGKMFPGHLAATKERTSKRYSRKPSESQTKQPQYLSLRKENGQKPDVSWANISPSLGDCLMPNTGESPREESESSLSQILEADPHPKYYLSAKACLGILRRAEKRGRELPEILKEALLRQAEQLF